MRIYPFLVGSKIDDADNEYLDLIIELLKIIEIVFASEVSQLMLVELDYYVKTFNAIFKRLFPHINPINKQHHITHYAECIWKKGPIQHYSCLFFEQKHFDIKRLVTNG